ncbi:uncharacterized protein PgNI_12036 [Pyricularia grisea]|uniref:Uncharacterized protein n=1 Tax=Pyricularia grisea TaxID=148305 RepID=A0A6P8AQJ8_PYRGI|nr:uncharacterized protein PgNI_12036 [Pyricularia grisea]TLD04324.1 hypothetical protein PgNI_12036 [Pyricularia grisea]
MKVNTIFNILVALAAYIPTAEAHKCVIKRVFSDGSSVKIPAQPAQSTTISKQAVWVYGNCQPFPVVLNDGSKLSGEIETPAVTPVESVDEDDCFELDISGQR